MKVETLNCPSCGAHLPDAPQPNQEFACNHCGSLLILTDLETADQVRCARCGQVNQNDVRFCRRCGARIQEGCPFCYEENPVGAVHCEHCGANLEHARQRKKSWLQAQRHRRDEALEIWREREQAQQQERIRALIEDLDEPENHGLAIYSLHQIGEPAVEALIQTLTDEDPDARFGAARTLGQIRDQRAVLPLIAALKDPEPAVRYWAADSLGKFRDERALEPLRALLSDPHKGVRQHAIEMLRLIGGPDVEIRPRPKGWRRLLDL